YGDVYGRLSRLCLAPWQPTECVQPDWGCPHRGITVALRCLLRLSVCFLPARAAAGLPYLATCRRPCDPPDRPWLRALCTSVSHSLLPTEPDHTYRCRLDPARCWLYALPERDSCAC